MTEHDTRQFDRERQMRTRIVMLAIPAFIGVLSLLVGQRDMAVRLGDGRFLDLSIVITSVGALLLLVTALLVAMTYLQTGFRDASREDDDRFKSTEFRNLTRMPDGRLGSPAGRVVDIDRILADLSALKEKMIQIETATSGNTDEQVAAVAEQLTERVLVAGGEELLRRAGDRLGAELQMIQTFHTINETFEGSKERLSSEISRLERKSNFNLSLGGLTTILGIGLLGYAVFFHEQNTASVERFAMAFVPRLSVVVLLQVFAFFFLKLYKANLGEVKYFQNEITNVEHRQIAINAALERGEDDQWKDLLMILLRTERNRILEKGQTTIDIERARIENDTGTAEVMSKLVPLLRDCQDFRVRPGG